MTGQLQNKSQVTLKKKENGVFIPIADAGVVYFGVKQQENNLGGRTGSYF